MVGTYIIPYHIIYFTVYYDSYNIQIKELIKQLSDLSNILFENVSNTIKCIDTSILYIIFLSRIPSKL